MSYLDVPRLHVIGGFYTDPSSVNNDPRHFDPNNGPPSPWQMPSGRHHFQLQNCLVCTVLDDQGMPVPDDPVVGAPLASTDLYATPPMTQAVNPIPASPAKMVDLDVYQQAVSAICGLQVSLTVGDQTITGNVYPPPILNSSWFGRVLPTRAWNDPSGQATYGDDANAVGTFQSQIQIAEADWAITDSPALAALRQSTLVENGTIFLSFKMVLDSYVNIFLGASEPNCYQGRLVGTIGPVKSGEAVQSAGARWLQPRTPPDVSGNEAPWYYPKFYGAPFKLDEARKTLVLDLAGALTMQAVGGGPADLGSLDAVISPPTGPEVALGAVSYDSFQYNSTAGITELPLTDAQCALLASAPLLLRTSRTDIGTPDVLAEDLSGLWWAADTRTLRMNSDLSSPLAHAVADVYVTQWGVPAAGVQLGVEVVSVHGNTPGATVPPSNPGDTPQADGALSATVSPSNAAGVATVSLTALKDCGSRAPWLDSQLYFVNLYKDIAWGAVTQVQEQQVSVLLWADYATLATPAWEDVSVIMERYDTLYPAMKDTRLALTDQTSFTIFSWNPNWQHAFGFPATYSVPPGLNSGAVPLYLTRTMDDPRYMPVSRDLSPNKIATILNWIKNNPPSGTSGGTP